MFYTIEPLIPIFTVYLPTIDLFFVSFVHIAQIYVRNISNNSKCFIYKLLIIYNPFSLLIIVVPGLLLSVIPRFFFLSWMMRHFSVRFLTFGQEKCSVFVVVVVLVWHIFYSCSRARFSFLFACIYQWVEVLLCMCTFVL